MPYTFYEGFSNSRVTNDLRARGYFVGSGANTIINPSVPYGSSAVQGQALDTSANLPAVGANDPLLAQLSGRTMGELWRNGGFIAYWRALTWIPVSTMRLPAYDGTNWVLPTTNLVTGSYIGTSTNGSDYSFATVGGAQNQASYNTPTGQSNTVYDPVSNQVMWADQNGNTTVVRYGNTTTGFAETNVLGAATNSIYGMYTNAGRTAIYGSDGSFAFVKYSDAGGAGPWTNHNVSGNQGIASFVRHPTTPNSWAMTRVGAGGLNVSIDNLATNTFVGLGVALTALAASPTAIVGVGSASGFARTTAPDISVVANWTTGTLPVGSQAMLDIAYGNGKFVALSNANFFVSSDDGLTWQTYTVASQIKAPNFVLDVTQGQILRFINGRFVLCGHGTEYVIAESTDGLNWYTRLYAYTASYAGTDGANISGVTGVFLASTSGVPTITASNGVVSSTIANNGSGFLISAAATQTQTYSTCTLGSLRTGVSTTRVGMNQWHEFQVVFKPTTTVNEWTITFLVDDLAQPGTITSSITANLYPWFNMSKNQTFTMVGNVVLYEMSGPADMTSQVGPDLRIYDDTPASDDLVEWNPSNAALSNALNIATGTVTGPTTFVSEAGVNKADQYVTTNHTPGMAKILSVKNEAYFTRTLDNMAYVSVGLNTSGSNQDSAPVQAVAPVGSLNYVAMQSDLNPITSQPWTTSQLAGMKFRIRRATNDPVTTFLCHCDGTAGATTAPMAINVGNGTNRGQTGAVLSTAQAKFGTTSIQIVSGSRWDFTAAYGGAAQNLGASDFTMECWVYTPSSTGAATIMTMDNLAGGGAFGGVNVCAGSIFASLVPVSGGNTWTLSGTPTQQVPFNQWVHVAFCRKGPVFYYWVNGVAAANSPFSPAPSATVSPFNPVLVNSTEAPGSAGILSLGVSGSFVGFIDEIRISRGARYLTAFTPPTGPFTN